MAPPLWFVMTSRLPPILRFRSTVLALSDIRDPGTRYLLEYWERKRAGRRMPARADVDPVELKSVLGRLLIIEVMRQPLDFRYRLAGTKTFDIFGHDLTGLSVRDIQPPEWSQAIWSSLTALVETGEPQYVELQFETVARNVRIYRVLRLPLGANGQDVDQILLLQEEPGDARAAVRQAVDRT